MCVMCISTYHTPAVTSNQENALVKNSTAGATAALQDRGLKDVPLVSFGIIALDQHHIKVGKSCYGKEEQRTEMMRNLFHNAVHDVL